MKTPEEMAEEYALFGKSDLPNSVWKSQKIAAQKFDFLAGYKAAQEHAHAALEEAEAEMAKMKDQLADVSKVMPDSCDHILDMEKMVDVNGWISVHARLPDNEQENVLVLISGDGWHDHDVAYYYSAKWYDKYDDIVEGVTHWQELPELPKEEE
jgi:hypothetical protein